MLDIMRRFYLIPLLLALLPIGRAQAPQTTPTPNKSQQATPDAKAPVLTVDQQKKFFKTQSESLQATDAYKQMAQEAQQKKVIFQAVVDELKKACGDFELQIGKDGDLMCVAKPAPAQKK